MYSETLEKLIQSVIADGEISEKERNVLHKKAEAEGIDIDELDVYVDGLIVQQRKAASLSIPPAVPKGPEKQGVITKCPNCGAVVEAGAVKCEDCGYVFRGVEANSSSKKLAEQLAKIDEAYRDKKDTLIDQPIVRRIQERASAISSFPVPFAKEELMEFIITMKSKYMTAQGMGYFAPEKNAYKAKYNECLEKARLMFPNDPQFQSLFEEQSKTSVSQSNGGCLGAIIVAIIIICGSLWL